MTRRPGKGVDKAVTRRAPDAPPSAIHDTAAPVWYDPSALGEQDLHLFGEGTHSRMWERLGSHVGDVEGRPGTWFAVWAPSAAQVTVMGEFNGWNKTSHPLRARASSGIWEGFVPGVGAGATYKYHIVSRHDGYEVDKADPFAVHAETPPLTGSKVWPLDYQWGDGEWMERRRAGQPLREACASYEMHLGSWRRRPEEGDRPLTYRELAELLPDYLGTMGFTHVEFLPVMEHPFYGSWGYQVTGYFAPTSRFGTPQDFMYLVDRLHQAGIGVLLDWVPSHFPTDEHGLAYFDGTHLYEHGDPRQGFHPDWNSFIFNYGRHEVRSFLLSSAVYWLHVFHADGLRVDAVASMLYLDYSRKAGEWIPNVYGGRENLDAVGFLRRVNETVYADEPGIVTVAEESTAWPMVSRPTYLGGLGFGFKWDMGWMHDTLQYTSRDPVFRRHHHNELTFRGMYAFTENFVLPLSHDEVVHGKHSLLEKMPGDEWQQFANLRLLFGYMYTQPGKKLLFMGGEFAQRREWNHDRSLDWHLLEQPRHQAMQRWVRDLNTRYRELAALHEEDCDPDGFRWIDASNSDQSVLLYQRRARNDPRPVVVACNFTPVPRHNHRVGVPRGGRWEELLNSDAPLYGGSGQGNLGGVDSVPIASHGHDQSIVVTLPPLGMVLFRAPAD
ncbi:MAG: 1,4-alpha-glucan branching protein GlgB [Gemmatimonadales bacterium]